MLSLYRVKHSQQNSREVNETQANLTDRVIVSGWEGLSAWQLDSF